MRKSTARPLYLPNSIVRCLRGGKRGFEMTSSITSFVVVAIVLAGSVAARAQSAQDGDVTAHVKAHSTHHVKAHAVRHASRHHRKRTKEQPGNVADTAETGVLTHIPSVFRNCEHPLPWYCAKPTGSLWFGSLATLERHRRTAWFGPRYSRRW